MPAKGFSPVRISTRFSHTSLNRDVLDFVEWFWWTGMRPGEARQLT
jgi:hypothetical protein